MIRKLFIILTLIISTFPLTVIEANATDFTTSTCDLGIYSYSVDLLTVETGAVKYTSQGCYDLNGWYSALEKFNQLKTEGKKDIVIRYLKTDDTTFQSPLKIVMADRAMAYTQNYTYTVGDVTNGVASTIGIYHNPTLSSRYTYLDNQEPLVYYETNKSVESNPARPSNLVAYIEINGAQGYIKLTGIDIVPFIYIENSILVPFYVKLSNNSPKQWYVRGDGRIGIFAALTKYTVNANNELSVIIDRATTVSGTLTYSKAPSWLTQGTYYSANGINFYTDIDLKVPKMDGAQVGAFYSYYNYLNLRTKTNYNSTEIDTYLSYYDSLNSKDYSISIMKDKASAFISSQNTYGVNALLVYAMGVHESDYGISAIALAKNNLFGYGANDSNPGDAYYYESVEQSVDIHMGKQLRYYLDYNNNSLFYASNFGSKGAGLNTMYASDPFWNVKISGHAYRIDRYLGFKDFNAYQIAILDSSVSSTLYKESNLTNTLYSINTRAKNYPFTIKASHNDTYYVQSTNPIVNNVVVTSSTTGLIPYNFDLSQAYINKNQVKLVNTPLTPVTVISDTDELLYDIEKFEWLDDDTIYIKGMGILDNTAMPNIGETKHTIILKNTISDEEYLYEMNVIEGSFNNYNNLTYNSVRYDGNIDVSTLPDGSYYYILLTEYADTSGTSKLSDPAFNPVLPEILVKSNKIFKTVMDNWNYMEYQLIIQSNLPELEYSLSLPSEYMSVVQLYDYELSEDNTLSINGIGYIYNLDMSETVEKTLKLILISKTVNENIYMFDLESHNQGFDPSIDGYDYSYSWFRSSTIDISTIPDGDYKVYIYIKSGVVSDLAEIRDFSFKEDLIISNSLKTINLRMNNSRREYELNITTN